MIKKTPETVILLNFGCKDIQKHARAIRSEHIYTMVMPWTTPVQRVMQEAPVGLIACRDAAAAEHPAELEAFSKLGVPLLKAEGGFDAPAAITFCKATCGCKGLWTVDSFIEEAIAEIGRAHV